ncbi:MAG: type I-E CRISPR-associated protein Cas7/Cse4/CasC [Anaerolineae bacterium]|nr:type I-E CRISPR-associated protein Cas7/Cse4/CasC [Anaerolineales bacterium]MCQ3974996.1 type I-E CRISPR-associated protein Cas7/Cse4/CasC [Anaerolineae bacterium]
MLIQIHMLQNYAPSNLNRDDSGSPKSAVFGGHPRGRVSSQCLKRSIRRSQVFQEAFKADGLLADRTNRLPRLINTELEVLGVPETARQAIIKRLPEMGKREGGSGASEEEDKELKTRMLVYLTPAEAKEVAQKLWALYQEQGDKGFAKLAIGDIEAAMGHAAPRSVDIGMFGRMTTSIAFEDVQAAVQVAHALSTHRLVREFDYFTAVDDISGETGAGMIGDVEFNSSTYYKYFNIHWESLVDNLGGETETALKAVTALIEAAALAQPSGKQNSTAAQNLPDFVLVEISPKNIPVSYANAFLKPAFQSHQASLMQDSIQKLNDYAQRLRRAYELNGRRAYFTTEPDISLDSAEDVLSLPKLQAWAARQITEAAHA